MMVGEAIFVVALTIGARLAGIPEMAFANPPPLKWTPPGAPEASFTKGLNSMRVNGTVILFPAIAFSVTSSSAPCASKPGLW